MTQPMAIDEKIKDIADGMRIGEKCFKADFLAKLRGMKNNDVNSVGLGSVSVVRRVYDDIIKMLEE